MLSYRLATPVRRDLTKILNYLLEEAGARVALDIEGRLLEVFRRLAMYPALGHQRADLTGKAVLFVAVSRYLVVYRVEAEQVDVIAILDGSRDVRTVLGARTF
jgi:plasmid stabilization system protein ParE